MLCPLALSIVGIVLLPRKARPLPIVEDILHQILAEGGIELSGPRFMRVGLRCYGRVLMRVSIYVHFKTLR